MLISASASGLPSGDFAIPGAFKIVPMEPRVRPVPYSPPVFLEYTTARPAEPPTSNARVIPTVTESIDSNTPTTQAEPITITTDVESRCGRPLNPIADTAAICRTVLICPPIPRPHPCVGCG